MTARRVGRHRLRVTVVARDGSPVVGALVMIVESTTDHNDIAAVTDDGGSVVLDGLGAGRVGILARSENGRERIGHAELGEGDDEVTLTLQIDSS